MFFVPLFLFILLPFAGAYDIRHVNSDGAILVESSPTNYALSSALLQQSGWKTVSMNGDNIAIVTPSCQTTMKSSQSLTDVERNLIGSVKNQLGGNTNSNARYSTTRFTSNGITSQSAFNGMSNSNFNTNSGASITKNDDSNYSIARPGLPMNLARVFINNDVVTFVYLDGQIQMKPTSCLQPAEQQLLQQLRLEVQQAEEEFRQNMQRFQQNLQNSMQNMNQNLQNSMQNMNQNLQNSMQNMRQNMNGIFGRGFPNQAYNGYYGQQQLSNPMFQAQQQLTNNMVPMQAINAGAFTIPNSANAYNPFSNNFMQTNPFGANFPLGPNGNPFANFGFNG